jgi:hypothetical protein
MTGKQKDLSAIPEKLANLKNSIAKTKDILEQHFNNAEV